MPKSEDGSGLRARVDAALGEFLDRMARQWVETPDRPVFDEVRDYVLAPGKRIRPTFCYWGWRAAGGTDGQALVTAASSLELLHAALLVHDDVIDGSDDRRGRPALHRALAAVHNGHQWRGAPDRFGLNAAITCGDLLMLWSDEMYRCCGLGAARLRAGYVHLTRMRTEVLSGQYLDLDEQARGGSLQGALRVIGYKTASYTVQGPLRIGAALAGTDDSTIAALGSVGLPLGEAFQLRDDLLSVFGEPAVTGKPNCDDLREGKPTVLMALTRLNADARQLSDIAALFGDPDLTDEGASRLREIIIDTGADAAVEKLIEERAQAARDALAAAPIDPVARVALAELVTTTTRRDL